MEIPKRLIECLDENKVSLMRFCIIPRQSLRNESPKPSM